MKCQHCGSNDIALIQGQNYCLNCGNVVLAEAPKPKPVREPPVKPRPSPAKRAVRPAAVKAAAPKKHPVVSSAPVSAPTAAPLSRKTGNPPTGRAKRPHPLEFSVVVAGILGALVAAAVGASLWLRLDTGLALFVVAFSAVVAFGVMALAQAALYYGLARSFDGRPVPRTYWWAAARRGFMDVVNVRIMSLICLTLLVGLAGGLWFLAPSLGPLAVRAPVLGLLNLGLVWLAIGVYVAERMAVPAVIVGGLTATRGLQTGWRLYLKVGGHLLATGFEALVGRLLVLSILLMLALAAFQLIPGTSGDSSVIIGSALSLGVLCFAVAMIILEIDVTLWLRQYREWATLFTPTERVRLLTGRVQARPEPHPRISRAIS